MDEYIDRIILSLTKTQDKWKKDKHAPEYAYGGTSILREIGDTGILREIGDTSILREIVIHKYYHIMLILNTYYSLDRHQGCRLIIEGITIDGMTDKKYEELKKATVKLLKDKNKRAVERKRLLLEEESVKVLRKLDNCQNL